MSFHHPVSLPWLLRHLTPAYAEAASRRRALGKKGNRWRGLMKKLNILGNSWGISWGICWILLLSNSAAWAEKGIRLSIATGGTGGIYYPMGSGIAGLISKHIPDVEATAEVTSASVDNCQLVGREKANLALTIADTAWESSQGKCRGSREKIPLRVLAVLYPVFMHLVTLEGKGMDQVTDLKGKRVSTGMPGGWTETTSMRILEAFKLNPDKEMKREKWGPFESGVALRENKIDAYFWGGGFPASSVTDLALTPGTKMKLISHADAVPMMRKKYGPIYVRGMIPGKTYFNQEAHVLVPVVWNLLVCHENMKEELAYQIIRTLIEHRKELETFQQEAVFLTPESQTSGGSPVPYHPGAIRFFEEKGVRIK
jgi:uncharacterized protein